MRNLWVVAFICLMAGCAAPQQPERLAVSAQPAAASVPLTPPAPPPVPPKIDPVPKGLVCDEVVIKDHRIRDEVATVKPEALALSRPLVKGGKIVCRVDSIFGRQREYELSRVEVGSYQGAGYRIYYTDGGGTVQGDPASTMDSVKDIGRKNWDVRCRIDRMDDTKWCSITKEDLTVGIWKDGSPYVTVGRNHYPGTVMGVRVGKGQQISANEKSGFTSAQSKQIISDLKLGAVVITRYQEWPYKSNVDKKTDLFRFVEAWSLLNLVYKNITVN